MVADVSREVKELCRMFGHGPLLKMGSFLQLEGAPAHVEGMDAGAFLKQVRQWIFCSWMPQRTLIQRILEVLQQQDLADDAWDNGDELVRVVGEAMGPAAGSLCVGRGRKTSDRTPPEVQRPKTRRLDPKAPEFHVSAPESRWQVYLFE